MTDFDLTSYLANGEDDEQRDIEREAKEAIQPEPPASEPDAAPDFDLTSYLSGGETPRAQAQDDDYGVMGRQRDSIIAETGEDMGSGEALARNLIPFVGDEAKTERYNQLQNLQSLYDNSALKDIQSRREKGERGDDKAGSRKKRDAMMEAINNSSFMGTSGFGAALQQVQRARAQEKKAAEETYFDQLESVAKNAGLDKKAVKGLRDSSATVEEFAEKLRGATEGELKAHATRRKEAQARLEANKPGVLAEIANGLITNTGYTGKYIVASAAPMIGLAGIAAQSAEQRATKLQTKDYDVDDDGSLVVLHTDDTPGAAAAKGVAGGVAEVAVEQFLEKGLGLAYKGIKRIPGVGKVVGAVGDTLAKGASKITGAIGAKFAKSAFGKSAAGKWLTGAAENFGKYQRYTGVNNLGWEMTEEHVQNFADTVLGFDKKSREYTTLGNEAHDWWHNQFLNYETNREIFMGLVGTMALQGAYAGTKAHHDIQKWRNNKGGFLKTVLDDKTVDALSDTEIEHLYNFVNSKRFTKENVDRLLARVNDRVEYANAILGLKEANTPFFDTNKGAIDEAVASGAIKSKFVPPTVEVNPDAGLGRTIDWRPYTWKDGTRTQRVFDPETGIAIDKLGGNRLCVTNRDGARIVVDGETAGDSFARALSVADKMSISNQLLDAKRPAKEAYIKKRIAETAQGDNFILVKNGAEFEKRFPELAADNDYNPNNPAVTLRNGKVVLVTDNIRDAQEVNRMILHEAAIHSGLKKALTPAQKRKFLHSISDPALDAYKRRVDERRAARGLPKVDWDSDEYAEEAFAHVWDSRRTSPMLSQKVDHFVRETGRKLHLPVSYNENDLEVMVDTLQRDANKPGGSVTEGAFDTADSSESVPYNEARRDYSGEVADTHKPVERTADETALRNMARNDRIAAAHPNLWEYALRETDGDEDAAAEYVSGWLEEEARNGKKGEMERAHHALRIAEKIENGEDLKSDDMDILEENGFSGQILYTDYGYRRQKDGTWKKLAENREETLARLDQKDAARREVLEQKKAKAATKEEASETRTVAHEEQAEPEPRVQERSEEAKAAPTKATEVAAPKKPRVLSGAALARKESAAKERKLLDRFIDNDAPRGVMAFIREEGRLMAKPERVRVRDAHGNISWRYQDRVAGDALDNFFDGMNASESKFWSNALFGEGASSKDYATGRHGDNAQDDLREWFGRNDYTVDKALAQLRKEYDEYKAFKERGGLTREEAETEKRYQEELAREIEIDGTVYDKDALAENETAHEIYNSALVEVLRNSGEAETMFSRNELRKLKPGDTLRVGNSEEVFAVDSYDEAKGELVVSETGIAGNPLFTDEEVYRYTNRRFRVTENGWSEEPKPPFKKEEQHEEAKSEPEPRQGTDETEPRDETRERGGQEIAAKSEVAPEAAEVEKASAPKKPVSRKPVTASVEFGGYNARRYSKPWIAKVTAWDAGKQPVIEFGNYVGDDDGGTAEISARAGDVVRYGQKDYRGRGTTKQYGIVQADGSVQDVSDKEAMEAFRANAKAEKEARAEEKSDASQRVRDKFNSMSAATGVPVIVADSTRGVLFDTTDAAKKATEENRKGVSDKKPAAPEKKEASAAEQERLFGRIENFAVNSRSALENFIKAFDKIAAVRPLAKDSHGALQMGVAQRIAHSIASSTYATPAEKIRFGILAEGRGEAEKPAEKPDETGKPETPAEKPKGLGSIDLGGMGDAFGDLGNQIRWFARDMEERSEEELQAHNLVIVIKMIKIFAEKGGKTFERFARTFAAYCPEPYRHIKNTLPGFWLNASIAGVKIEDIDKQGALAALAAVDADLAAREANDAKTDSVTPEAPAELPKHATREEAISAAADEIAALIDKDEKFTRQTLEKIVGRHLGGSVAEGSFEMKEATDILELAVNRYMKDKGSLFSPAVYVGADSAKTPIRRIEHILSLIPTQTTRSAEQDKMQQFSTPPHEAFLAAWTANVGEKDVSLEPSAGIGGIAVFSKIAGADVILNELSPRRREILGQLGLAPKVYDFNAENLWSLFYPLVGKGEVKRPTVVVMNPPFSNAQRTNRKDTIGVGGKHIEEALDMLAPGGRLVAIVGHGMAHDAESPKVRAWWRKINAKYQVRADVTVDGKNYAKYGTTYDNNLIVIDKVAPDKTKAPVYGIIHDIGEGPQLLWSVRNDRPAIDNTKTESNAGRTGSAKASKGNGSVAASGPALGAGTGNRAGGSGRSGQHTPERRSDDLGSGRLGDNRGKPVDGSIRHSEGNDAGNRRANNGGAAELLGEFGRDSVGNGVQPVSGTGVRAGASDLGVNYADTDKPLQEKREVGNGTFSEYKPTWVSVPGAKPHPTPLVESTAMASVLPPKPTYKPILPESAIKKGQPSDAQIEQIVYAGQAHEKFLPNGERKGYFIGDGTGVGKGTEISGIIYDNFAHGRKKAVWVSKSSDLLLDAKRDLETFGLGDGVFDFTNAKKAAPKEGIAFLSYDGLSRGVDFDSNGNVTDGAARTNYRRLADWLGVPSDYDGLIVFDESHKAGNATAQRGKRGTKKASLRGQVVVALQKEFPKARVLYVSATGATEVSNLAYATRLGLWGKGTAFGDREQFVEKVSAGGLSVMEIVARDMKSMGDYMARTLSYEGIVNRKLEHRLSPDQIRRYDEFADAWRMVSENINSALVSSDAIKGKKAASNVMSAFWGAQQRFFNTVLTSMQMPSIMADAKKQLAASNSVVFQLVNTNEASQEKAIKKAKAAGEEVNAEEMDLSPRDILIDFVERSFPTIKYVEHLDDSGKPEWGPLVDADGKPVQDPAALEAKENLLTKLRMMKLDNGALETIVEEFGAENVAEITGRTRRREMVRNENGEIEMKFVRRSPKMRNVEIDEFNEGKRRVLVFSDAGGTGKSFHADRRFKNQQKRIHYLVQAGWRADGALQGFGRTHRSNEATAPEYVLCTTDIKGHKRFISSVARRLAQLGSLTAGDRSSAGSGIFSEEDNLENQYAKSAIKQLFFNLFYEDFGRFNDIAKQLGFVKLRVNKRTGEVYEENILLDEYKQLDTSKLPDIPIFLNRILNCRVETQNNLFGEFEETMHDLIETAKDAGKYDPGLEKLPGDSIKETDRTTLWNAGDGTGSTDLVEIEVGKRVNKMPFDQAQRVVKARANGRTHYFARNVNSGKVFGFAETSKTKTDERGVIHTQYRVFSPDGTNSPAYDSDIRFTGERANFERLGDARAEEEWNKAFAALPDMTTTKRYFAHGTLLPIWDRLGVNSPRIFRIVPTGQTGGFLGMEIAQDSVNAVLRRFGKTPASIELTPDAILNRIMQEGKAVALQNGWELRRARVNGAYRVELKGPESVNELVELQHAGLGFAERIGYVPRFFIPRTKEGVEAFLAKYPAMPDDGGLSDATDAANDEKTKIMNMTSAERVDMLTQLFEVFETSYRLEKRRESLPDELSTGFISDRMKAIVSAMQSQEIFGLLEAYQSRDSHAPDDTVHMLRTILKEELDARHELKEADFGKYALWYSRDLDPDDFSAIAIRDVNLWRKARKLPEIKKPEKTSVKKIIKEGKYLASNTDEMDRFIKVSLDTPTGWTAAETNAVQQRRIELENDYDEKTYLINQAEMNGNKEEAQKIREARNQVQDMIDTLDRANRFAAREWGLTGLARRFLLNRDGTFARFAGEIRSDIGRPLTEEEERGARMLWDAYRAAQGKLDEETIRKTGELLKDVLRKKLKREEAEHKMGHGKSLKEIEKEYSTAIDHLVVHANRSGGYLFNLPNGRRWIDAIRRYHMAAALETGHTPSVDEMIDLIAADVHSAGLVADAHDIMQIITGHGNTYEADSSELEKSLREQRALMNEYQKWEDMMDEGHLPDKTGLIRDEPTQQLREAQKKTREMMREFMEKHPELAAQDATKRLKTIQDSLMKRWQNEIADLQKAIDSGVQISKGKNHVVYTPEMEAKRRELEEKRREYNDMFPAQPLTHAQKLDRYLRALNRQLAMLEEKREALENAKTDAERAAILGKKKGEQFTRDEVGALRDKIAEVKDDIQDLHDLYFPAGTYEEFRALVDRRRRALMKNIERIQAKLNARDFGPQKHEPSELAKRVANAPEVVEATRLRNAAAKRLMQERERYKRSVLPYNAGRAIDWMESLMAAPRVFRTMLDFSATLAQGAALFESHPVLGYSALVNSIKSFASEKNTDTIMAALMADPDYSEFIEMGGHIYNVSSLDERGVPEEFRGITQKLVTIKGKKYALEDIPGVKASERSFGMFLNCMNISVYKAIKAYDGWGPTGPSISQKKDIALALNVATGRGYENKGGHGTWDRIMSFLWWAPRYAFSGFKMATGANILAPHWTGDITERSYKDRMVSSKQAAKEWGRQIASMAAWTLLVTLLAGRKDPEWLEEVLNPLSPHFLNVRWDNTELNFFGPIKQWWTFMARFISGKTVGVDGVERERDRAYTAGRFIRGKLSPLASLAVDLVGGQDFLGDKLVWNRSAEEGEKNAWKHIGESLGAPLSVTDLYEVFAENSLANALMLTPFMLAGAGKSTYQLDEYSRKAAPFKSLLKQYRQAQKEGRFEDAKVLRAENPILGYAGAVNNYIKRVESTKKQIRDMEKRGVKPSENIMKRLDIERQQAIEIIEKYGEAR